MLCNTISAVVDAASAIVLRARASKAASPQIAGQRFGAVNAGIGIAKNREQHIRGVAMRVALIAEHPWHADLVDSAPVNNEGAQAIGDHRFHLDLAAQGGEYDPVEMGD